MNRSHLLDAAIGLVYAGTSAHADLKDPLPDSLSLGGVTLYGTIDVGCGEESARRGPSRLGAKVLHCAWRTAEWRGSDVARLWGA
jgi:hypothetical protein